MGPSGGYLAAMLSPGVYLRPHFSCKATEAEEHSLPEKAQSRGR